MDAKEGQKGCMPDDKPNSQELKDLAIYLEGMKKGQGNLYPLGFVHLENLWRTIKYLQNNNL